VLWFVAVVVLLAECVHRAVVVVLPGFLVVVSLLVIVLLFVRMCRLWVCCVFLAVVVVGLSGSGVVGGGLRASPVVVWPA
jgi:hypothetical protein